MTYFVRIDDAADVRRRTLESSKDLLHILKGYHALLETRDRKKEAAEELRRTMTELASLAERIEKLLPAQSLKEIEGLIQKRKLEPKRKEKKAAAPVPIPKEKSTPKPRPEKPKPMTELERLEQALAGIEQRLGQL